MLSSVGNANLLTLGTYSSAKVLASRTCFGALATEEAHFKHLRHFRTLHQRHYVLI